MSTFSKESKLQTLTSYLACCPLNILYVLNLPASKKTIAKKVVGTIFSYMRKRKQERHKIFPLSSTCGTTETNLPTPPSSPHPPSGYYKLLNISLFNFSTSLLPFRYHSIFPIITSPPKKVTSPLNTSPPIKLTSPHFENTSPGR